LAIESLFLPVTGQRKASKDALADAALRLGAATSLLMRARVYAQSTRPLAAGVTNRLGRAFAPSISSAAGLTEQKNNVND